MPKFRLKPGEIEAVQFNGSNWVEMTNFCGTRKDGDGYEIPVFNPVGTFLIFAAFNPELASAKAELYVQTQGKHAYVNVGDWIVKGYNLDGVGGFHRMSDDTFQKLYESIGEE